MILLMFMGVFSFVWSLDLIVQVADRSKARLYGECVIFAYLQENHFANEFAPIVLGAARAFPHVVFVGIEGRQSEIAPGKSLPKAFPVLLHLDENGTARSYLGEHGDMISVLEFISIQTGESPLSWNPPTHGDVGSLIHTPPNGPLPLSRDPYFFISTLFLLTFLFKHIFLRLCRWNEALRQNFMKYSSKDNI